MHCSIRDDSTHRHLSITKHVLPALFASLVLLMAAAKKEAY
jgi:hypothetical protein